jgi:hypothetical protein
MSGLDLVTGPKSVRYSIIESALKFKNILFKSKLLPGLVVWSEGRSRRIKSLRPAWAT